MCKKVDRYGARGCFLLKVLPGWFPGPLRCQSELWRTPTRAILFSVFFSPLFPGQASHSRGSGIRRNELKKVEIWDLGYPIIGIAKRAKSKRT